MSIAMLSDMQSGMGGDHDAGLDHPHDWARDRGAARRHGPTAANPAALTMPSSALHDDAIYGAH